MRARAALPTAHLTNDYLQALLPSVTAPHETNSATCCVSSTHLTPQAYITQYREHLVDDIDLTTVQSYAKIKAGLQTKGEIK